MDPSQYYKVETTWTKNANRATNVPYAIGGGVSRLCLPVTVNQQQSPVGTSTSNPTGGTTSWQELGVYEPASGTLVVTLSNAGANGNVIADGVRLEPTPASGPAMMAQAGTGSASDPVVLSTLSGSVQTLVNFGTTPAGGVSQKTFTLFNGGGAALSLSNLSVPAGYTVVSGGFGATPVTVPPGGSTQLVLGQNTSAAGTFSGTVTFTTNDSAENPFSFPVTAAVGNVAPTAAIANSGPVALGNPVTVSLGNAQDPSSADVKAGFRYSFALTEAALSKTYATTGTTPSATYTFAAAGTYTVWGRILDVNGLYTDYSTPVTVISTSMIVDDGGPGWTAAGTWTNYAGQGYDNDVDQAAPATPANATCAWTFGGLNPSDYYKVETTWTKYANRATNAPYTISGGTATLAVAVNQQQTPVGVSGDNGTWQELGLYRPTSGTLAVTLSNNANGDVIADAVRIEPAPAGGPAIMVQAGTGSTSDPVVLPTLSASAQTTVSFGTVVAGGVSQETFTVLNGGGAALSLSNLSLPAGYTLVSGFGATTVPAGGSTQFVLAENTSALGTLGGTVTFHTTDGSVNPFSFPVTGTVIDVAPTAAISNSGPVTQGSPVTVSLGNPYDPSSADTAAGFRYSFALTEAALSKTYATTGTTASATYTLATAGTYTVWGRILDKNNLYTDYSTPVTVNGLPMVIAKAGAANFQTAGKWTSWEAGSAYPQGYADDDQEAAPDSSSTATATAAWTFSGLTAGATYQVYVTWPASRNRATNVPYTVTVGGSVTNVLPLVNQQISPPTSIGGSGPSVGAYNRCQLGTASYTVGSSGALVVGVSNAGTKGNVEADAVLLVRTQPELAAGGPGNNPSATPLTASEAMPLVREAELRWAVAGANVSALGNVQVAVVNLPGTELGESSSVVDTIFLDTNAKGYGWFIDPTSGQDSEFPVQVAKTEELATRGPAAGEMDLLTVIMHEMGHFLGHEDLAPQVSPYALMSADLAAGIRRLPDSVAAAAVTAAVAQGRSGSAQASGLDAIAAEQVQAQDAVFTALAQPQGGTTQSKAAAREADAWWCCTGRSKLVGKSLLGQPASLVEAALRAPVPPPLVLRGRQAR